MRSIPNKNEKEWKELVTGQLDVPLQNFFFQMKLTQTKNLLLNKKITIDEAVEDIHSLCVKFSKAKNMDKDIEAIFGVHNKTTENTEAIEYSKTAVNGNGELVTHSTADFSSVKSNKISSIEKELEKIKREAAKREAEFKKNEIEFQEKIAIEAKAREKIEQLAEIERKNRILQEESNIREQKTKQSRLDKEKIEKEALRQASVRKRKLEQQKKSSKKRNFFQRFFNLD